METVVLYTSHYGATKQYATALAAALGAPCFALGTEDAQAVRSAGRIVYGGGLYAVSYTHLTLPTNREVEILEVAGSLKKEK